MNCRAARSAASDHANHGMSKPAWCVCAKKLGEAFLSRPVQDFGFMGKTIRVLPGVFAKQLLP